MTRQDGRTDKETTRVDCLSLSARSRGREYVKAKGKPELDERRPPHSIFCHLLTAPPNHLGRSLRNSPHHYTASSDTASSELAGARILCKAEEAHRHVVLLSDLPHGPTPGPWGRHELVGDSTLCPGVVECRDALLVNKFWCTAVGA